MGDLRIVLLGPPGLYQGGRLIPIQRRVPRALLFYLAMQDGPVGRGELLPLLWPDKDDSTARRNLRDALARLRTHLPEPGLLLVHQDQVGLDFSRIDVDAREFQYLASQLGEIPWRIPVISPLPGKVYLSLNQAVLLWRSPRFMPGANLPATQELDDWLQANSQRLEHIRERFIKRLADHAIAAGDADTAILWLRQAIEYDQLNEALHHSLMKLLSGQGQQAEIQSYWKHLKKIYRREPGGEVPQGLVILWKSLRLGPPPEEPAIEAGLAVDFGIQVPLVGREKPFQDLKKAYLRGGVAVILGEAGAGKSRLVHEFYESLQTPPKLMAASARETERNLAFQPLIDLLRRSLTADDWRDLPGTWIRPLLVLLPELSTLRPEIEILPSLPYGQDRNQLFEALHNLLGAIAARQRLLFVLDNAQWADEATLAALTYLIERAFFTNKGLLIINARHEELTPHLSDLLNLVSRSHFGLTITLELLNEEEIANLTRYALGQTPAPEFLNRLMLDSAGNPLFILETLRAILDYAIGPNLMSASATLPLPGSIHALIHDRLKLASPEARQALAAAAILGNEFDLAVLEKTSQLDVERTVEALEDLERLRLVRPIQRGESQPGYYLLPDKVREVVIMELGPARKRLLHQRAARALEENPGRKSSEQAVALAQHYEAGGDTLTAFHRWTAAALSAHQSLSFEEVNSAYYRAERLLPALANALTDQEVFEMYASWSECASGSGDAVLLERISQAQRRVGEQRQSRLLTESASARRDPDNRVDDDGD